jgi:predicted metal-dependent peptidase
MVIKKKNWNGTNMANEREAREKIDRVLINWFHQDAMMLGAWCLVDKIADKHQKTMGIDTRVNPPIIKYNPNFVNAIHPEQLEGVMAAEGFKMLLRHPTTRLMHPKHISSLSSTVTINQMMNATGFEDLDEAYPLPSHYGLEANKFYEEYFRNLMDQKTNTEDKIKEIWDSMSKEEQDEAIQKMLDKNKEDSGEGEEEGDEKGKGPGEGDEEGEGEGEGEGGGCGEGKDGDGYQEYNSPNSALKDHFDPNGTSNEQWGPNNLFDADVQNMVADNKGSMKKWGSHTGDFLAEIVAANEPKISWKEIVRRFKNSVMTTTTRSSRMKVNRRYDLDSPGSIREYQCKIAIFVDISGSMSDKMLQEGFAVINAVCKHAEITYGTFDTEIKQVETKYKKAKAFKVLGRGGTIVEPVIQWIDEHKYDGLVVFSDMYFSPPPKPRNTKVLWLCTAKDQHPPVDWGFVAKLDMYESHY